MANNIQIDNKVYKERGIEFAKKYRIENGRVNFSHSASVLEPPDFLAIQKESYNSFLQKDVPENKRKNEGLQEVLNSIFPIVATNEKMQIEFISYSIGEPKISEKEARRRDKTYAYPFKIKVQLTVRDPEMIVEQEIFVGDIPAMTDRGTFIINGAERVVVSQIHRSPGVVFNRSDRDAMFVAKIIPERGTWLEFELDTKKDIMYVRIDRKKKLPVTVFLRAIGITTNEEILKLFYTVDKISLTKMSDEAKKEALIGRRSYSTVYDTENPEEIILNPGELINTNLAERLLMSGIKEVEVLNMEAIKDNVTIINTLDKDATRNQKEACAKIYNVIRPGEPALLDTVVKICNDLVFDSKSYALGDVGRYKINKRLNFPENEQSKVLRHEDIIETIRFLIKVFINEEQLDDIDHLGNRRIRSVGELLAIQMKTGFTRLERIAKERMQMQQSESGAITPQSLVSIKLVQSVLKEFYGTSQLSQFMDQNNPLAEITHKRRLNALGPGGLTRDRAGFEVRDVHHTHYGKICPIETPEGPNIGLIVSLATYARINKHGFLEAPYRKVIKGKVTDEIEYLTAHDEERFHIADANAPINEDGTFKENLISTRYRSEFPYSSPEQVQYMDVSPQQIVSLSSSLIPFLEHDDANRALMGSNMQRQSVPLLFPEAPIVGTGVEAKICQPGTGIALHAKRAGKVIKVVNNEIVIKPNKQNDKDDFDVYELIKYQRTNQ
ncbi:DNA-directed RNA polymerase subunit beta, partial [Brachyspira aalborgi]